MLTEDVLNSVIVLMLVTATLGPILTSWAAERLTPSEDVVPEASGSTLSFDSELQQPTIVVPVYNPTTQRYLIQMAALLASQANGKVMPLAVTPGHVHMDSPELGEAIERSRSLLSKVASLGQATGQEQAVEVPIEPLLRIDDDIAMGISRTSREQQATLIVMGWSRTNDFRSRLFGSLIDRVLWSAHCPVAITRLMQSPTEIRRILVPLETPTESAWQSIRFAALLAQATQAEMTLLHVANPRVPAQRLSWVQARLEALASRTHLPNLPETRIQQAEDVAGTIAQVSQAYDLVVLRTPRRRHNGFGELTLGSMTMPIVQKIDCAIVMLGEPQYKPFRVPGRPSRANSALSSAKSSRS